MRRPFAAVAGAALVVAGGALAAATPVSPGPGAPVSSSHPVFSWTLPPNERAQALYVADSPDLAPDGKFLDENLVASGALAADQLEWSPSNALYTGHYRWLVGSSVRQHPQSFYKGPTHI